MSKNYGLKILVRVRMYARMYDCQDSTSDTRRTHYQNTEHHWNTRPPEKGGTPATRKDKICDCGEICTQKMKKVKKSL